MHILILFFLQYFLTDSNRKDRSPSRDEKSPQILNSSSISTPIDERPLHPHKNQTVDVKSDAFPPTLIPQFVYQSPWASKELYPKEPYPLTEEQIAIFNHIYHYRQQFQARLLTSETMKHLEYDPTVLHQFPIFPLINGKVNSHPT